MFDIIFIYERWCLGLLDKDTLEIIGKTFIGDIESYYSYKKGAHIYSFFNKYFNYKDQYWGTQQPSRWVIALNKLIEVFNSKRINEFFTIILGLTYLHKEYPSLNNDELARKSIEIMSYFNKLLKADEMLLIQTSNGIKLMNINDDLMYLGDGGFATVYLVKSQKIVLKKLKEENYVDSGIVSRFKREYEMTKKLGDIYGVISVYNYDAVELSYTMEYAEMDLYKYISTNNINFDSKLIIIYQVTSVMKQVHRRDIIHRDISPNNILLFNGLFKMSDFGLGKDLSIFNSHQTNKTNGYGQYAYCDPKQFMKLKDGDKSSDIYSIGKLINFIFTRDPNNTEHELKGVSEKATTMSELARYKTVDELESAITSIVKILKDPTHHKQIEDKINKRIIDEFVIAHINTLDAAKTFKGLQNKNFMYVYQQVIAHYESADKIYSKLNALFEEVQSTWDKNFEQFDAVADIAIFFINGKFEYYIKEAAIDLLTYIGYAINRYDVQNKIEKLLNDGIDILLEEKIMKVKPPVTS